MRHSHAATALAAMTAGLTAALVLHRRADRRSSIPAAATGTALATVVPMPVPEGVVLPFVRPIPTAPASEQATAPARCGDSGGRTKAGAPCAARPTAGGRCHHHPLAA
ncbi:MAG TPA: hypothetical protein VGN47_02570 [Blastococcus sp.]|jgi:hypothetical protein|nr:hypothetical protein [Blastococcus sp.]